MTWIIIGLIAGLAAEMLMGSRSGIGVGRLVTTTVLGLIGALLGGLVSVRLGFGDVTGLDVRSIVIATIGAVGVIFITRLVTGRA